MKQSIVDTLFISISAAKIDSHKPINAVALVQAKLHSARPYHEGTQPFSYASSAKGSSAASRSDASKEATSLDIMLSR